MNGKMWIIFSVVVVAIISGMIYMSSRERLDVSDLREESSSRILPAEERNGNIGDRVFGNKDAKILLIEYGDYQCSPGCRMFHENFTPIMQSEEYKEKIAFVYRNFPIPQIHPNAIASASAAEAAGQQGKFWEMWDALLTNQAEWSSASPSDRNSFFERYATAIGVELEQFRTDQASEAVSKKIAFDRALGAAVGISGTPTIILNGEQVDGERISSTEAIKALLDEAIAKEN